MRTQENRHDARELDVQYLLGHSPARTWSAAKASTYNCEQAARRHAAFSPAEMLAEAAAV